MVRYLIAIGVVILVVGAGVLGYALGKNPQFVFPTQETPTNQNTLQGTVDSTNVEENRLGSQALLDGYTYASDPVCNANGFCIRIVNLLGLLKDKKELPEIPWSTALKSTVGTVEGQVQIVSLILQKATCTKL